MIYFVKNEQKNEIKIGFTKNITSRFKDLCNEFSEYKLTLLKTISGDFKLEKQLHKKFALYNSYGEWFRNHPELESYINDQIHIDVEIIDPEIEEFLTYIRKSLDIARINGDISITKLANDCNISRKTLYNLQTEHQSIRLDSFLKILKGLNLLKSMYNITDESKNTVLSSYVYSMKEIKIISEYDLILSALRTTRNNKSKAANMLNIDRKTLANKLKKYKILHVS